MKSKVFKSVHRGGADYGWLKANYSFSFANYYNPEQVNFGALRVLNDDSITGNSGFGMHPHDNMEIITIPLEGKLQHKDNMSDRWIDLKVGEVQVMSAGTGVVHSERNGSSTDVLKLFQIWIFPDKANVDPVYDQRAFDAVNRKNKLQTLVQSYDHPEQNGLKIYQDARITRIALDAKGEFDYETLSENHGVFAMLIDGEIEINESILSQRDAIGIEQTDKFKVKSAKDSDILFIEVPMKF